MMKHLLITVVCLTTAVSVTAATYKCEGDLVFTRTVGTKVEVKNSSNYRNFAITTNNYSKSSVKFKDGKYSRSIPVTINQGVYFADSTKRSNNGVINTVTFEFDEHSKDATISVVMTKGDKTLDRKFIGKCVD